VLHQHVTLVVISFSLNSTSNLFLHIVLYSGYSFSNSINFCILCRSFCCKWKFCFSFQVKDVATEVTAILWHYRVLVPSPVCISHTLLLLSNDTEKIIVLSREIATEITTSACSLKYPLIVLRQIYPILGYIQPMILKWSWIHHLWLQHKIQCLFILKVCW